MPKTDHAELLAKVPIFQGLTKRDLKAIARSAKEVTHRRGAVLAKEGDTGVGFFLIVDGTATVTIGNKPIANMEPGDFFGEISLIDNGPRTATVTADTEITTLGLTPWTFQRLIQQNPTIASKMLKVMAQRLRTSSGDIRH